MKIKVKELTEDGFLPFGTFMHPDNVDANRPGNLEYYPDQLVSVFSTSNMISTSLLSLDLRDLSTDIAEKHDHTEEIIGGFQGDVVFHVALPSDTPPRPEDFSVFRLPAGCFVRFKRKVWHHTPFPVKAGRLHGIVILPPFTYTHDSRVIKLNEKIEIDLYHD